MSCLKTLPINQHLLPVKASYFFTLAGVASLLPYLSVYMKQAGLSPAETSIIYGTMPFIGAIVRPLLGVMADKTRKHKAFLLSCCILTGLIHACLLVVPHNPIITHTPSIPVNMSCLPSGSRMTYCPEDSLADKQCTRLDMKGTNKTVFYYHDHPKLPDPLINTTNCSVYCRFDEYHNVDKVCFQHDIGDGNKSIVCPEFYPQKTKKEGFANVHAAIHRIAHESFPIRFDVTEKFHISSSHNFNLKTKGELNVCHNYELSEFTYKNHTYEDYLITCPVKSMLHCKMECQNLPSMDFIEESLGLACEDKNSGRYGRTFVMFFFIYLVAQIAFAPIFSLIDAMTYDFLGEERGKWGQQRMWGTLGFAVFAVLSGLTMDLWEGSSGEKDYTAAFVLFAMNMVIAAFCVCLYRVSTNLSCTQMMDNFVEVMRVPEVLVLVLLVFMFGVYQGVIETFVFWHLTTLGSSQLLLGLCMVMSCIPEIAVLFCSGWIMEKLGHVPVMCVVCVAVFVRLVAYSFLTDPWWALAIEPLHAVTFGLMYASASSYGSVVAPPGMHGTIQGLIGGVYFGIGKGIGSVTGGQVFEHFGAHKMFKSYGISALAVLVLYIIVQVIIKRSHSRESGNLNHVDSKPSKPIREPKMSELKHMNGDIDSDDTDALVANDPMA